MKAAGADPAKEAQADTIFHPSVSVEIEQPQRLEPDGFPHPGLAKAHTVDDLHKGPSRVHPDKDVVTEFTTTVAERMRTHQRLGGPEPLQKKC